MTMVLKTPLVLVCIAWLTISPARGNRGVSAEEVSQQTTLYHAGHAPHHVTRLHRYEQNGVQSMLEEEAKWTQEMRKETSQKAATLRDAHRMRGSSLLEEGQALSTAYSGFVKVSDIQAQALQAHHRSWSSWLQTLDASADNKHVNKHSNLLEERKTSPFNGALLQRFKSYSTEYRKNHSHDEIVATALSSLNSQYVGPIGVGTVVDPPDCKMQDGATPTATNKSVFDTVGSFVSSIPKKFANISSKVASAFEQSCTMSDQSKVWVVFDTGSTNIWIASDLCKDGPCRLPGRHMFNHEASATFKYPQSMLQLTVQFGTGKITGPQAVDDFHIGPFTVYNQTFAMIETETGSVFRDVPFEGIVGMAFDKMSANKATPFFSSMIQQKALTHNEFAFYFSKDKPSANAILWGGVDKKFYEGDLQYFPVVDPYYWSLKLLNFKIGDHVMLNGSDTYEGQANPTRKWNGPVAVVDTGTTFFTAEGSKFGEVMSKLPPANCNDVTESTHPPITISLENMLGQPGDFVLTNKEYMSQSGTGASAHCSPAFMQIDLPEAHGPGMVLGEIFLRHFFAVFDRDSGKDFDAKVAFGRSSDSQEALSRLHELTFDQPVFTKQA